jgi:hypothetical protein
MGPSVGRAKRTRDRDKHRSRMGTCVGGVMIKNKFQEEFLQLPAKVPGRDKEIATAQLC